jgi:protein translocase SEC61 complex gamma subunit
MNLKASIERMKRILLIANKPDKEEYRQSVKITGLGFAIIGIVGFFIFLAVQLVGGI